VLPRRPRIQGRAAALPYQKGEEFCRALFFLSAFRFIFPTPARGGMALKQSHKI
jgi:hypothetical protein